MITQNGSAFSLPSPISHEVLHQSEKRRLGTQNKLRKDWKKSPMNDTPHHGLFSYTIGETKTKNITPYVSSDQLKKYFTAVPSILWGWKNNLASVLLITEEKEKAAAAMQHRLLQRKERKRFSKQIPLPPPFTHPKQLTYPSLSLCPPKYKPNQFFPFPHHREISPFRAFTYRYQSTLFPPEISHLSNFSPFFN